MELELFLTVLNVIISCFLDELLETSLNLKTKFFELHNYVLFAKLAKTHKIDKQLARRRQRTDT